jgi:hypothetical protein
MRRTVYKLGVITIILAALLISGCSSSSDPLDEIGQRYTAFLSVEDNEDSTLQVDTFPTACSVDETEEWSDTLALVEITVTQGAPGITLQSYDIEYRPLGTPYFGGSFTPPPLNNPARGYATFSIPSGGTGELPITLLSVSTKFEFDIDMGWYYKIGDDWVYDPAWQYPDEPQEGRYTIRVRLNFEDVTGNKRTITIDRTALLKDYNNC